MAMGSVSEVDRLTAEQAGKVPPSRRLAEQRSPPLSSWLKPSPLHSEHQGLAAALLCRGPQVSRATQCDASLLSSKRAGRTLPQARATNSCLSRTRCLSLQHLQLTRRPGLRKAAVQVQVQLEAELLVQVQAE